MAKLGYTWYPKDWNNSDSVFELDLCEKGAYRGLIDLAMMNDNKAEIKKSIWSRKWNVSDDELNRILDKLCELKLIEFRGDLFFIPSCESRLNLVRGGSNGGKISKPKVKPIPKPTPKPKVKQTKRETKTKLKGKEGTFEERKESFIDWFNKSKLKYKQKLGKSKVVTPADESNLKKLFENYEFTDFEIAIKNLYKSKWADENNMQTISHFLRIENFNKYLEQGEVISNHQVINSQPVN